MEKQTKIYAANYNPKEYDGISYTDLEYFGSNYILRCIDGPFEDLQCGFKNLGSTIHLGSDESSEIWLDDKSVSKTHCIIESLEDTLLYTIEDNKSEGGTWMQISNQDNAYVFRHTMILKLFDNVMELNMNFEKNIFYVKILEGVQQGTMVFIQKEITIGKKDCDINLDLKCKENLLYTIYKENGKICIANKTKGTTDKGMFYKLTPNQKEILRPGDIIQVGQSTFKILFHNWGYFSDIGNRSDQQDQFCIIDDLRVMDTVPIPYYAIYDGHGGTVCSYYLKENFHRNLKQCLLAKRLEDSHNFMNDFIEGVRNAFLLTDFNFYKEESTFSLTNGSTCVCLFFVGTKVICANLGDSLSILAKGDGKRVFLSRDLKPNRQCENERIKYRNGFITNEGRLLGTINVSRSFGDWKYKDPENQSLLNKKNENDKYGDYLISNRPEIRILDLKQEDSKYIILTSDGIFQNLEFDKVFGFVNKWIEWDYNNNKKLLKIPHITNNVCLDITTFYATEKEVRGSADNMTFILVHLDN